MVALARTLLLAAVVAGGWATSAGAATGSFQSSDPEINQIWAGAVKTAEQMLAPGGQEVDALDRTCPTPANTTVILDGVTRDRCPYIGDESVIGLTYDAANPHWDVQRTMLGFFAALQRDDGAIPSSPLYGGIVLYDYCGYWAIALHNYVLYSGDVAFARRMFPALVRLIDRWYPSLLTRSGLLDNAPYAHNDYAFIRRQGNVLSYFNAQYAYVLRQASEIAFWVGKTRYQTKWRARAERLTAPFQATFWDTARGSFFDTATDRQTHPLDGNVFAILSGIATRAQAVSSLDYIWAHQYLSYGDSISDVPTWDNPTWGYQSNLRVYPFIGFYELLARFQTDLDASAFNLIRREWGYMNRNGIGTGTDWELIAPYGAGPTDQNRGGSWSAGWSSGAAPALTEYVLGVRPTSPGYTTYTIDPHPGDLTWARGNVVTPRGLLHVEWKKVGARLVVRSSLTPIR